MRIRPLPAGLLAWGLALLAFVSALRRPEPLFVNLGAGDDRFARGFRGEWERDGLRQTGETMFRWTADGSRLELPVNVRSGRLTARLRLARFAPGAAEIRLLAGERVVEEWTQPSRGWMVRTVDLGEMTGPLRLRFRSTSPDEDGLGVALDWVEVGGAESLWPGVELLPGLAAFLLSVPLLSLVVAGPRTAAFAHVGLLLLASVAVFLDRLGGLVAVAVAGFPSLLALGLLIVAGKALSRVWPEVPGPRVLLVPAIAVVLALLALSHPFFYYPDVDTHARYVAALRADPHLALDPRPYQARTGAWTREVGGRLLAFPYSPLFHLLALPLSALVGEVVAIKTVAVTAVGLTALLVAILSRAVGLAAGEALLAQAAFALLPVTASRLTLALYPALLAQALELLLVAALLALYPRLDGWRGLLGIAAVLLVAQAGYTGSLFNVGAIVAAFALLESVHGDRGRALRLLGACAATAALVVAILYGRFVPVLLADVLPHLREVAASGAGVPWPLAAATRLWIFHGPVVPVLVVLGLAALSKQTSLARRLLAAQLLAGASLLSLRYALPALFRDVKEIELLAPPLAVAAAAGLGWLWTRGRAGSRAVAVVLGLAGAGWGVARAVGLYAERFLAVGR